MTFGKFSSLGRNAYGTGLGIANPLLVLSALHVFGS